MMLADEDGRDRYVAAQWLNLRRWLDQNPDDALAPAVRKELTDEPARYARSTREYLGVGVFALMQRWCSSADADVEPRESAAVGEGVDCGDRPVGLVEDHQSDPLVVHCDEHAGTAVHHHRPQLSVGLREQQRSTSDTWRAVDDYGRFALRRASPVAERDVRVQYEQTRTGRHDHVPSLR
jgi:hypothetical protein